MMFNECADSGSSHTQYLLFNVLKILTTE